MVVSSKEGYLALVMLGVSWTCSRRRTFRRFDVSSPFSERLCAADKLTRRQSAEWPLRASCVHRETENREQKTETRGSGGENGVDKLRAARCGRGRRSEVKRWGPLVLGGRLRHDVVVARMVYRPVKGLRECREEDEECRGCLGVVYVSSMSTGMERNLKRRNVSNQKRVPTLSWTRGTGAIRREEDVPCESNGRWAMDGRLVR